MVSAEIACALPAVVLVLVMALAGVGAVGDQVRCTDAARTAARSLARGDDPAEAERLARELAPQGATIQVSQGEGQVRVAVTAEQTPLLPGVPAPSGSAVAPLEGGGDS